MEAAAVRVVEEEDEGIESFGREATKLILDNYDELRGLFGEDGDDLHDAIEEIESLAGYRLARAVGVIVGTVDPGWYPYRRKQQPKTLPNHDLIRRLRDIGERSDENMRARFRKRSDD